MSELAHLLVRVPRKNTYTPESTQTLLSTLINIETTKGIAKLMGKKGHVLSLEIVGISQQIHFVVTVSRELTNFVSAQITSSYPQSFVTEIADPIPNRPLMVTRFTLKKGNYLPIATYDAFRDVDPIASILSLMAKADPAETLVFQIALSGTTYDWQKYGANVAATGGGKNPDGTYAKHTDEKQIKDKILFPGFTTSVRLAADTKKTLTELTHAMQIFARPDGNTFVPVKPSLFKKVSPEKLLTREVEGSDVVNIQELATLWHLPDETIKIPGIVWGTQVLSESPENLPIAEGLPDEVKKTMNFFAKTQFKNTDAIFGMKNTDRFRHTWIIGKTGTGKSTLIANMVIDDIKKDRGVALIDPHGDTAETVLSYIPKHRINDTIYFNPADREFPIRINPLEVTNKEEAELVVSGIMAVFTKVWANVWSARMEYIMRNSLLTLSEVPGSTLADILTLLANKPYRDKIVDKIGDNALKSFWREEYDQMPSDLQKEAIAPIQNKVGQFVTSPLIRRIIGNPTSTIRLEDAMNEGKILVANLSQGRLGEDNAALLGAMLITKFQVAAMRRVDIPESERKDFFLYVDEFQNFATSSFIKILSEARKYRLALTLANQYMAQIPDAVQKAILGNVGTLISFAVGADDAAIIHKEFAASFSQEDLVTIPNRQVAIKLMIDGTSSRPFIAHTLPLPQSANQSKETVLKVSQERWGKKAND